MTATTESRREKFARRLPVALQTCPFECFMALLTTLVGASVAGSVTDAARAALEAGCDMVLICNSPDKADQI